MSTFTSAPVFNNQVMGDFSTKRIITIDNGGHGKRDGKACLMEWVSIFTEDEFGDNPKCTNELLGNLARRVNDSIKDEGVRSSLATRINQLAGTSVPPVHPARFILPVWADLLDNPIPSTVLARGGDGWRSMVRARLHGVIGPEGYDLREAGLRALEEAHRETVSPAAWANVISYIIEAAKRKGDGVERSKGDEALVRALDTAIAAWQESAGVERKPLSDERLAALRDRAKKLWAEVGAKPANDHPF